MKDWMAIALEELDCGHCCEGCPYHHIAQIDEQAEVVYSICEQEEYFWKCGVWEQYMGADL